MKDYIGIFDSGIGGLSILEKVRELLPNENILYYKDYKNLPYGNKSTKELIEITSNIVSNLLKRNCKIIVIACNTATTVCLEALKEKYPEVIFVGVVPAIKLATNDNYQNILLMATPKTIEAKRTLELIEENRGKKNIYLLSCPGLAEAIEEGNREKLLTLLNNLLKDYKNKKIDAVVLGCTHYSFIKDEIKSILKDVQLIDGTIGVSNNVKKQLEEHNLLNKDGKGEVLFLNSF